jgi:hypothetical protein
MEFKHYLDDPSLAIGQTTYRELLPFRNQKVQRSLGVHQEAIGLLFVEEISGVRGCIYGLLFQLLWFGSIISVGISQFHNLSGGGAGVGVLAGIGFGGMLLAVSITMFVQRIYRVRQRVMGLDVK